MAALLRQLQVIVAHNPSNCERLLNSVEPKIIAIMLPEVEIDNDSDSGHKLIEFGMAEWDNDRLWVYCGGASTQGLPQLGETDQKAELILMNTLWRLGLMCGLVVLVIQTAANAQTVGTAANAQTVGTAANAQTVGTAANAQTVGTPSLMPGAGFSSGGTSQAELRADDVDASFVGPPAPPSPRSSSFNRVTTTRRQVVSAPSRTTAGSGGTTAGVGGGPYHPLQTYSTPPQTAGARGAYSEVPAGSSQQTGPRQPRSQPVMVRSTPHNYYPSMRTGQYANANRAQIARPGKRTGMMPGIGVPSRGRSQAGSGRGR